MRTTYFLAVCLCLAACTEKRIDFNTQIKPILNKNCITCHGGVKRNGGFSVLFRRDALDTVESGKLAIIPGDPDHSEMIRRLTLTDPEERMPYKKKPLSADEINLLKKWIAQGAVWGEHWAYVAPKEVVVPSAIDKDWIHNSIDNFVLAKLDENRLHPSNQAAKWTLIRRVYLDLIGVPPTREQVQTFIADKSPEAYEKVVDELLNSPRFGEKWASWWLDLARYADTNGYEKDVTRSIWRYRDWVIRAFNADMPFDEFTVDQLAGDLLPSPTDDQLIATGFHRNTMNNDEGGTVDEEFRTASVIDRVNTTMEAWQSTTFGCVQCHSHPYDPFHHEDYYKFLAFFNNTRDEDTPGEEPNLRIYAESDQQKLNDIRTWMKKNVGESQANETVHFLKTLEPKHHAHDCDDYVNGALADTKWMAVREGGSCRLKDINLDGVTHLLMDFWADGSGGKMEVRKDILSGKLLALLRIPKTKGKKWIDVPLKESAGKSNLYFIFRNPSLRKNDVVCYVEWMAFRKQLPDPNHTMNGSEVNTEFLSLLNADAGKTPIMVENGPDQRRKSFVFERGNWLVHGDEVKPAVPESLGPMPDNYPRNRLGVARWIANDKNPLTARTVVNRFWEQLFGRGIVATLEDFGTEGELPTHPEMLDWLSMRFMHDYKWSMKKLLKEMVMSATYQQDSRVTPELQQVDPENELLARGPRVRLTAEQVRDQALAVSGLLSDKMYGPSVMPYQPDKVWQSVYNSEKWETSKGADRFRRGVYTFIKRTSPYPSAMMFDASSREVCLVHRIPTDTPLQALVTLNDPVYVEAAESLARIMLEEAHSARDQIRSGYSIALMHEPSSAKVSILEKLYGQAVDRYAVTDQEGHPKSESPKLEAMTVVATAILNLDEFINNE